MKKIKIRGVVSHFFLYCVDEEAEMMIENQQQRQHQEIQWQWEIIMRSKSKNDNTLKWKSTFMKHLTVHILVDTVKIVFIGKIAIFE